MGRGLLEKWSSQKSPFLEILQNLENLEILENPQTGESDHFLEILENLEIREIHCKDPFCNDPFSLLLGIQSFSIDFRLGI